MPSFNSHLYVVLECDRLDAGGARYSLAGIDEIVIGRGRERCCTRRVTEGITRLFVSIPGRSMSATHARIIRINEHWILEDMSSTNGSFVSGSRVQRAVLRDDDPFELGHTIFLLRTDVPTPEDSPIDVDMPDLMARPAAFGTLVPASCPALACLERIASSNLPLLLLGETGTGKEMLARSIHQLSNRTGPMLAVNCGALPPNLVESTLFGHVRGAFSSAVRDEPGAIRSADGGTLLLDEVGDLPRAAQAALLRFLQEGEIAAVGSARVHKVSVRVVGATHQPLVDMVRTGLFRSDLLARLSGHTYVAPPLRHRREDLGLLISGFVQKHGLDSSSLKMTPSAAAQLLCHDWPGNIRELEHAFLRGVALAGAEPIGSEDLLVSAAESTLVSTGGSSNLKLRKPLSQQDAEQRKELLVQLAKHRGNLADVARALGKARMQIHRWVKRYDIDLWEFRR